jgi:hypothetical protein
LVGVRTLRTGGEAKRVVDEAARVVVSFMPWEVNVSFFMAEDMA